MCNLDKMNGCANKIQITYCRPKIQDIRNAPCNCTCHTDNRCKPKRMLTCVDRRVIRVQKKPTRRPSPKGMFNAKKNSVPIIEEIPDQRLISSDRDRDLIEIEDTRETLKSEVIEETVPIEEPAAEAVPTDVALEVPKQPSPTLSGASSIVRNAVTPSTLISKPTGKMLNEVLSKEQREALPSNNASNATSKPATPARTSVPSIEVLSASPASRNSNGDDGQTSKKSIEDDGQSRLSKKSIEDDGQSRLSKKSIEDDGQARLSKKSNEDDGQSKFSISGISHKAIPVQTSSLRSYPRYSADLNSQKSHTESIRKSVNSAYSTGPTRKSVESSYSQKSAVPSRKSVESSYSQKSTAGQGGFRSCICRGRDEEILVSETHISCRCKNNNKGKQQAGKKILEGKPKKEVKAAKSQKALVKPKNNRVKKAVSPKCPPSKSQKEEAKICCSPNISTDEDGIWFECNLPFRVNIPIPTCMQNFLGLPAFTNLASKFGGNKQKAIAPAGNPGPNGNELNSACPCSLRYSRPALPAPGSEFNSCNKASCPYNSSARRDSSCCSGSPGGGDVCDPLLACLEQIRDQLKDKSTEEKQQKSCCPCMSEKSTNVRSLRVESIEMPQLRNSKVEYVDDDDVIPELPGDEQDYYADVKAVGRSTARSSTKSGARYSARSSPRSSLRPGMRSSTSPKGGESTIFKMSIENPKHIRTETNNNCDCGPSQWSNPPGQTQMMCQGFPTHTFMQHRPMPMWPNQMYQKPQYPSFSPPHYNATMWPYQHSGQSHHYASSPPYSYVLNPEVSIEQARAERINQMSFPKVSPVMSNEPSSLGRRTSGQSIDSWPEYKTFAQEELEENLKSTITHAVPLEPPKDPHQTETLIIPEKKVEPILELEKPEPKVLCSIMKVPSKNPMTKKLSNKCITFKEDIAVSDSYENLKCKSKKSKETHRDNVLLDKKMSNRNSSDRAHQNEKEDSFPKRSNEDEIGSREYKKQTPPPNEHSSSLSESTYSDESFIKTSCRRSDSDSKINRKNSGEHISTQKIYFLSNENRSKIQSRLSDDTKLTRSVYKNESYDHRQSSDSSSGSYNADEAKEITNRRNSNYSPEKSRGDRRTGNSKHAHFEISEDSERSNEKDTSDYKLEKEGMDRDYARSRKRSGSFQDNLDAIQSNTSISSIFCTSTSGSDHNRRRSNRLPEDNIHSDSDSQHSQNFRNKGELLPDCDTYPKRSSSGMEKKDNELGNRYLNCVDTMKTCEKPKKLKKHKKRSLSAPAACKLILENSLLNPVKLSFNPFNLRKRHRKASKHVSIKYEKCDGKSNIKSDPYLRDPSEFGLRECKIVPQNKLEERSGTSEGKENPQMVLVPIRLDTRDMLNLADSNQWNDVRLHFALIAHPKNATDPAQRLETYRVPSGEDLSKSTEREENPSSREIKDNCEIYCSNKPLHRRTKTCPGNCKRRNRRSNDEEERNSSERKDKAECQVYCTNKPMERKAKTCPENCNQSKRRNRSKNDETSDNVQSKDSISQASDISDSPSQESKSKTEPEDLSPKRNSRSSQKSNASLGSAKGNSRGSAATGSERKSGRLSGSSGVSFSNNQKTGSKASIGTTDSKRSQRASATSDISRQSKDSKKSSGKKKRGSREAETEEESASRRTSLEDDNAGISRSSKASRGSKSSVGSKGTSSGHKLKPPPIRQRYSDDDVSLISNEEKRPAKWVCYCSSSTSSESKGSYHRSYPTCPCPTPENQSKTDAIPDKRCIEECPSYTRVIDAETKSNACPKECASYTLVASRAQPMAREQPLRESPESDFDQNIESQSETNKNRAVNNADCRESCPLCKFPQGKFGMQPYSRNVAPRLPNCADICAPCLPNCPQICARRPPNCSQICARRPPNCADICARRPPNCADICGGPNPQWHRANANQANFDPVETVTLMQPRRLRSTDSTQNERSAMPIERTVLLDTITECDRNNLIQTCGRPPCNICQNYTGAPPPMNQANMRPVPPPPVANPFNNNYLIDPRDQLFSPPAAPMMPPAFPQHPYSPIMNYSPPMPPSPPYGQRNIRPAPYCNPESCPEILKYRVNRMPEGFYDHTLQKYNIPRMDSVQGFPPEMMSRQYQQQPQYCGAPDCPFPNQYRHSGNPGSNFMPPQAQFPGPLSPPSPRSMGFPPRGIQLDGYDQSEFNI